jgi:hypothetical protein
MLIKCADGVHRPAMDALLEDYATPRFTTSDAVYPPRVVNHFTRGAGRTLTPEVPCPPTGPLPCPNS